MHCSAERPFSLLHGATLALLAGLMALAPVMVARAAEALPDGEVAIVLHDALIQGGVPQPLQLHVRCDGGAWEGIWGAAMQFNRGMHLGEVVEAKVAGNALQLTVAMRISGDPWVQGGPAVYHIDLKRDGKKLTGTFAGEFTPPSRTYRAKGRVEGEFLAAEPLPAGFKAVELGEHPRLLFRKSDLPQLRRRAETSFGKAALERLGQSSDPVALGVMYQLTGNAKFAEKAFPATVAVMENRNGGAFALGRFWGYRTIVVANAYDLCYDAWTPKMRLQVENYLDWILYKCLHRQHRVGTVNWTPGSNYTVVIHAGNGAAALALWGEKGPAPFQPRPPRSEAPRIEVPRNFRPGRGAPLVKLEPGKMPTEWLWIGPFDHRVYQHDHPWHDYFDPVDCLAAAGGMENVQAEVGQKVAFGDQTRQWQTLPEGAIKNRDGAGRTRFDSTLLAGNRENRHLFFYTVLENNAPGYYRCNANFYEGKCILAGQRVLHNEVVHLAKGRFPLLVPVTMADGEYLASVQFEPSSEEEAKEFYADPARQKAYRKARAAYEADVARWRAADGANLAWLDNAQKLIGLNCLCLQKGMGDGGFQGEGEGYTLECHHVIHDYALAYRTMFGRNLTGRPDISHFVPRYVMTTVFPHDGRKRPLNQTYGRGANHTADAKYLSRGIALAPKAWQPAVLWFWLQRLGVEADAMRSASGAREILARDDFRDPLVLVQTFLNYPLVLKPENPGQTMPRAWQSEGRGFCCFRNAWDGPQSIVAQIYGRSGAPCGWSQAETGCFQIYGLGHDWARKANDISGKTGSRWADNVVLLPDDPIHANGLGRVAFYEGNEKTGSGSVTIDMDKVYECFEHYKDAKGKDQRRPVDAGIHGLRSFAADYSGKSGGPALFAVVDKIEGGKSKVWVFQPPRSKEAELSIDGNTFTIKYADASMRATVVSPAKARIVTARGAGAHRESGIPDLAQDVLQVSGEDAAAGDFFVVMTLQRGDAPEVKVRGSGLGAKVAVGGQTVSFDGQKIIFSAK